MALLSLLLMMFLTPAAWAYDTQTIPKAVIFDRGDPDQSVGVIGSELFLRGEAFENQAIAGFEPNAIILQDRETGDMVKLLAEGEIPEDILTHARYLFVVQQLRVLYHAQVEYQRTYGQGFAPSLEELIAKEFLAGGFTEYVKQGYFFEIAEEEHRFNENPKFLAVASPAGGLGPGLFFSVDELGLVRYADTKTQTSWGPVWDYTDPRVGPRETDIGVN